MYVLHDLRDIPDHHLEIDRKWQNCFVSAHLVRKFSTDLDVKCQTSSEYKMKGSASSIFLLLSKKWPRSKWTIGGFKTRQAAAGEGGTREGL